MLYKTQPDQSLIKPSKEAIAIEQDEYGVTVHLSDGTEERGDIVIGADGVHSRVRELMWKHINSLSPSERRTEKKVGKHTKD
jgi:2-polyprenyl-6-methoxyphenol hydroxylase-like FAD-dependent oxidoreductase